MKKSKIALPAAIMRKIDHLRNFFKVNTHQKSSQGAAAGTDRKVGDFWVATSEPLGNMEAILF